MLALILKRKEEKRKKGKNKNPNQQKRPVIERHSIDQNVKIK
jgi:hypothetical protein